MRSPLVPDIQKTLFLAEKYPPSIGGSCGMFASRFGLFSKSQVHVLAGTVEGDTASDRNLQYPVKRVKIAWKGPRGFEWACVGWQMFRAGFFLALKAKVLECARPIPEGFAGYFLSVLLRKPLIVNFHGEDISVLSRYRVERWVLKRIIHRARLNLANSQFTEGLIQSLSGGKARTAIVHPGFNPSSLGKPNAEHIENLRHQFGSGPILLTVGRIQRRKGQDQVIRAMPDLVKHFPGIRYLIIGSNQGGTEGLGSELEALAAQLGVTQNIAFLGEVKAEELPDYYSLCDAFIMANREEGAGDVEGFGIVFLEAGSMGKPVIGGRSGGVPDAVRDGETGLLVDGNSVPAIVEAVKKLFSDSSFANAMGSKGQTFAATMTAENIFTRYCETRSAAQL